MINFLLFLVLFILIPLLVSEMLYKHYKTEQKLLKQLRKIERRTL